MLISESEKNRILNLHKKFKNINGLMVEATQGADLVTPYKAIWDFIPKTEKEGRGKVDYSKISVKDGDGRKLTVDNYKKEHLKNGILVLRSGKKQAFNMNDRNKLSLTVNGKPLKSLQSTLGTGPHLMCSEKSNLCKVRFVMPNPKGLQTSDIKNKWKKLIVTVMFPGSKWDDETKAKIQQKLNNQALGKA